MPAEFLENMLHQSNFDFMNDYQAAGGTNGIFNFPTTAPTTGRIGVLSCKP
jgi:hypothetical protein